ncbi:hypothetical protein [Nonomuraea guangzhouensis]|uniref:ATP-grasp-modified RiPP n=1 Tax=Nonomuraea guangzhouensis TaxID=1291555 RepID=A0ABW4GXC8_9ACTN|nr:hypothetical protein [Nonomuraea guangzhouensis]
MARRLPKTENDAADRPPYYIATEALYLDGSQFNRAHNPGDRVPADHVEAYGWADKVRHPDDTPKQPPAAAHNEPETAVGQATTDKKGDA